MLHGVLHCVHCKVQVAKTDGLQPVFGCSGNAAAVLAVYAMFACCVRRCMHTLPGVVHAFEFMVDGVD